MLIHESHIFLGVTDVSQDAIASVHAIQEVVDKLYNLIDRAFVKCRFTCICKNISLFRFLICQI